MEDHLVCYGCGLIFPVDEANFAMEEDDPSARCPDCDGADITTYDHYEDNL